MSIPFDPIKRAREVEKIVIKDLERKYYRFRYASYYGGIATADTIGCCFLCAYCWNYFRNLKPESFGEFYSPEEVSKKILEIVERKNLNRVRISGAEPILGEKSFNHLEKVIQMIYEKKNDIEFILETNGLILGINKNFCKSLASYPLAVRISVKGWDNQSFEKISSAEGKFFIYQLKAIKNLQDFGIEAWPAVMYEIFGREEIEVLKEKLREMGIESEIEVEYLEKYPFVVENLEKRGIALKS